MFVEQLRRAVEASPRAELPAVSGLLWKAYAAGQVSEPEASELSALIEAKRAIPVPPPRPRLRVGSRPRAPGHMERRHGTASALGRVRLSTAGPGRPVHPGRDRRPGRDGGRAPQARRLPPH